MRKAARAEVCMLASGGIDSTACINFYLERNYRVLPVFVQYGQPASSAEKRSILAVCKHYGLTPTVVDVEGLGGLRSGELCGRNLFLISIALMATQGSTNLIGLGIHAGTRYFDCGPKFIRMSESLVTSYTDGRVKLGAPFLNWSKQQIFSYCSASGLPVHMTWSCEASSKKPCGRCLSCRDRENLIASA